MVRPYGQSRKRSLSFSLATPRSAKRYRGAVVGALPRAAYRGRLRRRNIRTAGFLGIEKKFVDYAVSSQAIVATASSAESDPGAGVNCLNAIGQGDGESQRDGRKAVIKSVFIRGMISKGIDSDQADAKNGYLVRILVVHDKQTNAAQLNSEDVLDDGSTTKIMAPYNMQYTQRFKVLMDRTYRLNPTNSQTDGANTGSVGWQAVPFKFYKALNMPCTFVANNATIADIADNSLHVIALANTTGLTLNYESRVRFIG